MIKLHRRMGRLAAVATAGVAMIAITGVAVAGAAPGAGTDVTARAITSLAYTCRFPSGAQQAVVRAAAGFPAAGTVGRVIQPTGVHMTVTVPHAAVGDLGRLGATSVRASAGLGVTVAEGRTSASTTWRASTARPARLPAADSLTLDFAGPVPPVRPSTPGEVSFTADDLRLVLIPRKANGAAPSPAALSVGCSPRPGQDRQLAAVPIPGATPSPSASGRLGTGQRRRPDSRTAKSCFIRSSGRFAIGSAFLAGYSNVNKLHESALIGPGPGNQPRAALSNLLDVESVVQTCPPHDVYLYDIGKLNYHNRSQFPPARNTFLNFGFVPVTATLTISLVPFQCRDVTGHLIATTDLCIEVKNYPPTFTKYTTTSTSEMLISVHDLAVNGVPLNVGQNCQTVTPTKTVLSGNYNIVTGGALTGYVTVPPFTGCGVGENLDPLLTASVSGPQNFAIITQGPLCLRALPHGATNGNCRIKPGAPGYPYGVPKYYPKLMR